ncbi:sulfite exporter TauE/SafE family protein [Pontibacillus marinus]|uniref:Probable membrane transporter protein n=1 Tax=Pontibacillus marinus BH030004 = DSM 16465 TaxID=1385511 RepID=A0A0A5G2D9_9BACI|nr:sulfite exporter TauE/SafE family protein [Pontibacillus marinus]KGX87266.1 membrane protein [Pontibacillus marinus BH030004 = DSM 16465]
MDILFLLTVFILGLIGSYVSGLVGIGGAIVNYPMLLYIPPLFGFDGFSSHTAAGVVAVQVLVASFGGAWGYRKGNYLHKPLIKYMGISILIGSLIGGFGAKLLSEQIINIIYGVLALIAVVMMFIPTKEVSYEKDLQSFHKGIAATSAFLVGIGAGIVGAGGAFLLVPIMLSVLHIPTRVTIASSLAITVISSIGAVSGKLFSGDVPLFPAIVVAVGSAIASPLGAKTGKNANTKILQVILAILIIGTAVKVWWGILF